jgi:hypothetical protein
MCRNLLGKDLVKSSLDGERIKEEVISETGCEEIKYGKGVTFGISLVSYLNSIFDIRSRIKLYLKVVEIFSCLNYYLF